MTFFDYVTDSGPTYELHDLCVVDNRIFAIVLNFGIGVEDNVIEVTGWPVDKENNLSYTTIHDQSTTSDYALQLIPFQDATRLILLTWAVGNTIKIKEYDLGAGTWSTLGSLDSTDLGWDPGTNSVIGKDADYIYVGAVKTDNNYSKVFYSGDSFASEFGAGWSSEQDTWCAESGLDTADRRRIRAIWGDSSGNVHFYGANTVLVPTSTPLYPADYDRIYTTSSSGVAFSRGAIAGGSLQTDCSSPYDPATSASYQMLFPIQWPDTTDVIFGIRDSDDYLVYSDDEASTWATVSGTFDATGSYSGDPVTNYGVELTTKQTLTFQADIDRWFILFSSEIVYSFESTPNTFVTLHQVTNNSGTYEGVIFWWDDTSGSGETRIHYQTKQSATTDVRIYQWQANEDLTPPDPPASSLIFEDLPSFIDLDGDYLFLAMTDGSSGILVRLISTLAAPGAVIVNNATGHVVARTGTIDSDRVWAIGNQVLQYSDNDGSTWSDVLSNLSASAIIRAAHINQSFDSDILLFDENSTNFARTVDDGVTWEAFDPTEFTNGNPRCIERLDINQLEVALAVEDTSETTSEVAWYSVSGCIEINEYDGGIPTTEFKGRWTIFV